MTLPGSKTGTRPGAEWFRRRPCFWWAASLALGAVTLPPALPLGVLLLLGVAGAAALTAAGRWAWATCLIAFTLGGGVAARCEAGGASGGLQAGRSATIRGTVERIVSQEGSRSSLLVRCERRRTVEGWVPERERLSLRGRGPIRVGDRVEASGMLEALLPAPNPGGFDARRYWRFRGVQLRLDPHERGFRVITRASTAGWESPGHRLRRWIQSTNQATLSPRAAAIADRFLIGSHQGADPEVVEELDRIFRDAGTFHLLVVSGTQVSAVLLLFIWLGKRLWRYRLVIWLLGLVALSIYFEATGGDASISRATLFGTAVVLGLMLLRPVDGENTLGLTLLVLVAIQPAIVLDIGAQLSFAAVWGLVRLAPSLAEPEQEKSGQTGKGAAAPKPPPRWIRELKTLVCANVATQLLTAPILAYHFQSACWVGLLSNLCVCVISAFLLPVCLLHVALAPVGAAVTAPLVTALGDALCGWSGLFGTPPLGSSPVFSPPSWLLPLFYVLVGIVARLPYPFRWPALGCLVAVLLVSERMPAPPPGQPTARAIDVGQGDAVLLQSSDGANVLVDAGPPPLEPEQFALADALRGLRVGRLDAIVISHAHADHIGGLPQLLAEMPTGTLVYSPRIQRTRLWQKVLAIADRRRIRRMEVTAGDRIAFAGSRLQVLAPDSCRTATRENPNEESLVVRWEAAGKRVLLMGDAGFPTEEELLDDPEALRAEVLKVGHHGSTHSTGSRFLQAVQAQRALISCGRGNTFGHPHRPLLERLNAAAVPVSRTDSGGMVTLTLDREGVRSESYLISGRH